jgi:asparagine synthase (glutamine-hydrolysing)
MYDLLANTLADNFLTKVDRATMHYGLEARSPFLDYRFVEFGLKIPTTWKVGPFKTKKFMREMVKGLVPQELLNLPKKGFTPPFREYLESTAAQPSLRRAIDGLLKRAILPKHLQDELIRRVDASDAAKIPLTDTDAFIMRCFLLALWSDQWLGPIAKQQR